MCLSEPRVSQPVAALVSILCPGDVQAPEQLYPYPWLGLGSGLVLRLGYYPNPKP